MKPAQDNIPEVTGHYVTCRHSRVTIRTAWSSSYVVTFQRLSEGTLPSSVYYFISPKFGMQNLDHFRVMSEISTLQTQSIQELLPRVHEISGHPPMSHITHPGLGDLKLVHTNTKTSTFGHVNLPNPRQIRIQNQLLQDPPSHLERNRHVRTPSRVRTRARDTLLQKYSTLAGQMKA